MDYDSKKVAEKVVSVFLQEIAALKAKRNWDNADAKNFKRLKEAAKILQAAGNK